MGFFGIFILAVVQGLTELLPVSSSAHVIVVERLLRIDPSSPEMTFILVMLHSGTMLAAIVYFWKRWRELLFSSAPIRRNFVVGVFVATTLTGLVGFLLMHLLERWYLPDGADIENLFSNIPLISASLATVGILIIIGGLFNSQPRYGEIQSLKSFFAVGAIQGLCLPFRGFSRSGATISIGTVMGMPRQYAEEFSFVLAVVLTPPILIREAVRLLRNHTTATGTLSNLAVEGLFGFLCSFLAGLVAIHWLTKWLEKGKWYFFGIYCLGFSAFIFTLYSSGLI